jgi:hypothetical protein
MMARWPSTPASSGRPTNRETSKRKTADWLRLATPIWATYYLVEAANSVRKHCSEYRHYYLTKFAQSPKHAHQRALVLTARKLVRLVDALLRAGSVYRPPTLVQNQEEVHTPPHAARPRPQRRARLVTSAS